MRPYQKYKRFNRKALKGTIYWADAEKLLSSIKPGSADIIFLDPPFNLKKKYTKTSTLDNKPEEEYKDWLISVFELSIKALREGGALYLYHLPKWAMRFGPYLETHLDFRHWISVSMKNGFVRGENLYPAHYALLYFTKGKPGAFSRPKTDPQKCRHCDGLVKDYGGYRAIIEEKGINLSDIWEDISPVRHGNKKTRAANELPEKLMDRVLEISGTEGGLYVDPFAGSGTGIVAAAKKGMKFLAGDIVKENCRIIENRIS